MYRLALTPGAALLLCLVVGVHDGDTLTAECTSPEQQTIKVRLAEVDAPESRQPFRARSKEHLASLCFKQTAEVRPVKAHGGLDRYGRTVAHVALQRQGREHGAGEQRPSLGLPPLRHRPHASTRCRPRPEQSNVACGPTRAACGALGVAARPQLARQAARGLLGASGLRGSILLARSTRCSSWPAPTATSAYGQRPSGQSLPLRAWCRGHGVRESRGTVDPPRPDL